MAHPQSGYSSTVSRSNGNLEVAVVGFGRCWNPCYCCFINFCERAVALRGLKADEIKYKKING